MIINTDRDQTNTTELKIISTRVYNGIRSPDDEGDNVLFTNSSLLFPCGGHTALEVLEVQLPGKKVMNAAAFWNGLRGQKLKIV